MSIDRTIKEWQEAIHANAKEHGWWPKGKKRNFGEMCMLMVSELSESFEEFREHGEATNFYLGKDGKPEGIAVEMGDVIIRILDWAEHAGVDMGVIMERKHEYNETRSFRHGGKHA